jgi:hypothetical protein
MIMISFGQAHFLPMIIFLRMPVVQYMSSVSGEKLSWGRFYETVSAKIYG